MVLFSFAHPEPWLSRAKASGAVTVCQVQTIEAARIAATSGADMLQAAGRKFKTALCGISGLTLCFYLGPKIHIQHLLSRPGARLGEHLQPQPRLPRGPLFGVSVILQKIRSYLLPETEAVL